MWSFQPFEMNINKNETFSEPQHGQEFAIDWRDM